tara:strand:- start:3683 stop:5398 length:1716 start_codon:yes stop_codon:yes gene_type:complete
MVDESRKSSSHVAAAVLVEVLAEQGVRHAVVSPGSRNAPIVLAMHHHPEIQVRVSLDERAAAHHALGLALATWRPVPVVSTSGTAAINHGPALAEAFHSRIPLLSVTADRPAHVLQRGHGQTVDQTHLHAPHTVHHATLDDSLMTPEELTQEARKAVHQSLYGGPGQSAGPVHLNVPLEEPLYTLGPAPSIAQGLEHVTPALTEATADVVDTPATLSKWLARGKVLVVAGARPVAASSLSDTRITTPLPCLAEASAGVDGPLTVVGGDRLLKDGQWPFNLQPEAILTLGLPVMSKALRKSLEGIPHWHIGEDQLHEGKGWDTWMELRGSAPLHVLGSSPQSSFGADWHQACEAMREADKTFSPSWSDLQAWRCLVQAWRSLEVEKRPNALHVANSASARYMQWANVKDGLREGAVLHANRGVAGIDGCTSTALGWHAGRREAKPNATTWMVTGDLAFHYDSNAMLTDPLEANRGFKVIVINNGGGGIFRWLPGTQHEDAFVRHFETPPTRKVEDLAKAMNAYYFRAENVEQLKEGVKALATGQQFSVLEILTPPHESAEELSRYLQVFGAK